MQDCRLLAADGKETTLTDLPGERAAASLTRLGEAER
jgi:hypothetical protein